jgi:hypothetical protein
MAKLSKEEKEELLRLSGSAKLKNDFERMRKNRQLRLKRQGGADLNTFIQFLSVTNAMFNHQPKPFKKMSGNNFKL